MKKVLLFLFTIVLLLIVPQFNVANEGGSQNRDVIITNVDVDQINTNFVEPINSFILKLPLPGTVYRPQYIDINYYPNFIQKNLFVNNLINNHALVDNLALNVNRLTKGIFIRDINNKFKIDKDVKIKDKISRKYSERLFSRHKGKF